MRDLPDLCSKGDEGPVTSRKAAEVGGVVEEGGEKAGFQTEGPGFGGGAMRWREEGLLILLVVFMLSLAPVFGEM